MTRRSVQPRAKAAGGLPDKVRRESAGEAHHKRGNSYHYDYVDGPRLVAFTYKVDVSRVAFVAIYVKVHSSALRLRCEVSTHV